ncbi:hypothetical protein [Cellulomonas dongxiuzhuiae]|uniref:hypothetical protein n=1 Tax=Cellulomonas dongxiuzhuiae TaxID=2819979 RepID=UPI001AAEBBEF|nr:hypothetical protein [Cellulomonas dongxiuzhuiae]MBO3087922.1 hypothetical protein [Cellulomonas dongxiuzhuiae]
MSTDPTALAPHVEARWRDAFVSELRLRDVTGDAIGDALGEVDAHCADAGQDAASAFGDPVGYARTLAPTLPVRRRTPLRDAAAIVTQTAGVMGVVWSVPPWLHGEAVVSSRGWVTTSVVVLLVAVALCLAPPAVLRWFLARTWWQAALVGSGTAVALAAVAALVPNAPLTAPSGPLVAVSVALLVAGALALHLGGATSDAVRTPGQGTHAPTRRARLASIGLSAALPCVALVVAGAMALLPR